MTSVSQNLARTNPLRLLSFTVKQFIDLCLIDSLPVLVGRREAAASPRREAEGFAQRRARGLAERQKGEPQKRDFRPKTFRKPIANRFETLKSPSKTTENGLHLIERDAGLPPECTI